MRKRFVTRQLLVLLGFLVINSAVRAQTRLVSGIVTDSSSGIALAGASIVTAHTKGTITDTAGGFKVQVEPGSQSISVSMVNYQTKTITLDKADTMLHIVLSPNEKNLDEVIVVGYGTQKRRDITGAISTVKAKEVGGRNTVQVSEALQGSMPGVSVTRSNGAPGASSSILVRGITTLNNNSALVIVDGVPVSDIDVVNPEDVESVSVLKDGASAAIYGSRAAAGVILVTTKRGQNGGSNLDYTYEYGIQKPTALPQFVGIQDYMRYFNEQLENDATAALYSDDYIDSYLDSNRANPDGFPNTNWQQGILKKTAPRIRHGLVFTSGTCKLKTKASFGYQNSDALYDNYDYKRYQFRINNDLQITKILSGSLDVAFKRTDIKKPDYNPIYDSRVLPAYYDDYYDDGRFASGKDGRNPLAEIEDGGFVNSHSNQLTGKMALVLKPLKGLSFTGIIAPTFDYNKTKTFSKQILYTDKVDPARVIDQSSASTTLGEVRDEDFRINGQLLANYHAMLTKDHVIDALIGYEENYESYEYLAADRNGFPLTEFPYLSAGSQQFMTNGSDAYQYALHSTFGRLRYDYKEKYSLQGTLRYDQSSRFSKQYRGALFPTVSGAWTISEEKFMKSAHWLSFLKIRASWANAGNERTSSYYPYQALIPLTTALFLQNGNAVPLSGGNQQVYAVPNISWETTRSEDIGIDATFLNNRLSISGDYYKKKTYDILMALDIPNYLGFDNPTQNAGTLQATGWELQAGWHDKIGEMTYSVSANLSDVKTRIDDLKGTQFLGDQANIEGGQFNEWFGYQTDGLFQSADELAGYPKISANTKIGDVKYVDVNNDGAITPTGDKVLLGGSLPRYEYGGNINLGYHGFDLTMVFQGVGKRLSRMPNDIIQPFLEAFGNFPQDLVGNFWSTHNTPEENLQAKYPRLSRQSVTNNYLLSDLYLANGAYFRVKNITLGYTLTLKQLKKAGIQSCHFYISGNDLFLIDHFPNYWDPESGSSSYPIVKTFMAGVNVRF